jgi:nicotinamidase-related amidase
MTLARVDKLQVDLVPELARYVPPANLFDKRTYSPWLSGQLNAALTTSGIDTLIVSGGETDVCVLATVFGAVDYGYRTIVVTDAVCSSSDDTHDAMQLFFSQRLSQQVETAETAEILEAGSAP